MKLETLKTYIQINLVNSFIKSSKSSKSAPIFLFRSLMVVFAYVSITEVLIICLSKIDTRWL